MFNAPEVSSIQAYKAGKFGSELVRRENSGESFDSQSIECDVDIKFPGLINSVADGDWLIPSELDSSLIKVGFNKQLARKMIQERELFQSYESWVGRISFIDEVQRIFSADLSSENNPDEIAEFSFSDVSEDDLSLLQLGAVFYWSVGQRIDFNGRKCNQSSIRFRRLKQWTRRTIESSVKEAEAFDSWFK